MKQLLKVLSPLVRPDTLVSGALHELSISLKCPSFSKISDAYSSGEHQLIVDQKCDPRLFDDAEDFRVHYLASHFLSKASFLNLASKPEEVARAAVIQCEEECRKTNLRFKHLDSSYIGKTASILESARWKISNVLGQFDCHEWFDLGRWGPGSTATVKVDVSSEEKFRASLGITPPLLELVGSLLSTAYPAWFDASTKLQFVRGNKVTFVPKNAKTHRPIAVEPDFNLWFQLSLGKMIRRRLKAHTGIDLNTQADNQSAAFIGSITGQLATLDLKSASDTISKELVRYLISDSDWFSCLDASRSRHGTLDGAGFTWEKFSSMGNGFTFELQTLIFWALASATCEYGGLDPCVRVFGDDVIIPSGAVPDFLEIIKFCGFSVNDSKSFWTGKFRESCGAHYFDGVDCQPIYLRSAIETVHDVYKLHNSLRRLASRYSKDSWADPRFESCCSYLHSCIPNLYRIGIPDGIGDIGFIVSPDDRADNLVVVETDLRPILDGWESFYVKGVTPVSLKKSVSHRGLLLSRLHALTFTVPTCLLGTDSQVDKGNSYSLRGRSSYRFGKVMVARWIGPKAFA